MFSFEPLENRTLLAFGPYPQLIGQDQAVSTYPTVTGAGVNIALIDSGVDSSQPNLSGKIWTNPGEIAGNGKDDDGDGTTPLHVGCHRVEHIGGDVASRVLRPRHRDVIAVPGDHRGRRAGSLSGR